MIKVAIPAVGADESLWLQVAELAETLPPGWVLVGGLMVQLHALEHDTLDVRATIDIDVLGQARPPGPLAAIGATLEEAGFEAADPDPDGYAFRYERAGVVVDVLAPDGIRPAPTLGRGRRAIGVPGGSQALERSEAVTLAVAGREVIVHRPTLLGAILMKTRALMVHRDPEAQREDLLMLLSLVEDPRALGAEARSSERGWLRDAEARLSFDRPAAVGEARARRARQAWLLMTR